MPKIPTETLSESFVRASEDAEGVFHIIGGEAQLRTIFLEVLFAVQLDFLSQSFYTQRPWKVIKLGARYFHTHQHL